jgi:hypothetical protein
MANQRSLRSHLVRAGLQVAVLMAAAIVFVTVSHAPRSLILSTTGQGEVHSVPGDSPVPLIKGHGCWEGAAPADMRGVIPGHVVVTRAEHVDPEYLGKAWVGPALDEVFGGRPGGLTVHAFCR